MTEQVIVHLSIDDGGPVEVIGGAVDTVDGLPFLSILDPRPYDSGGTFGVDVVGKEYLFVHVDRVVSVEGDHDRVGDLLAGGVDD